VSDTSRSASSIVLIVIKSVLGEWALSMVGVEQGREFRFRGDLYSQESTFPLVCFCICRTHGRDKQTDRPRYMRSNRPHLYAMHCDAS